MGVVDFSSLVNMIPSYRTKVWLIRNIALGLAKNGNVDEAVKVISSLPDAAWRWELLSELSSYLAEAGDCQSALKIFMDAKDNDLVLEYLLVNWDCVDESVEKALDSFKINGERIRQAVSKLGIYWLLNWFGFLTKAGRVEEALEAAKGFEEAYYRAEGLMKVAVALAERGDESYNDVLNEALNFSDRISDIDFENIVGSAAVEFASVGKGSEALGLAYNIRDDYELADILTDCLPHFEGELFESTAYEILEFADRCSSDEREDILNRLFSVAVTLEKMNKPLISRIIEISKSGPFYNIFQFIYAFKLLEKGEEEGAKLYEECMKKLREVKGEERSRLAHSLIPFVTQEYIDDFVKYIKEIPDMREQATILSKIATSQSTKGENEIALKLAKSITSPEQSSSTLSTSVQALSKKDFERALNTAGEITDKEWRDYSFSKLFAEALEKGEFKESLLKKVLADQARGNEKDVLLILDPAVISLVKAGRKELEDIVKLVSELDQLKTLKNTLKLLVKENVEGALKAAREGLGLAKPLALSAVAVKAYKAKVTISPKRILDEAKRETRRIKAVNELDAAFTVIALASAIIGKVEEAIELIFDKVSQEAQQNAIFALLTVLPTVGRVNNAIKLAPIFREEQDLALFQILIHTFEEGCISEFEKLVDSLSSYDFFPLSELINYLEVLGEAEWAQRLINKEKEGEEKFYDFSGLSFMFSIKGDLEQAKKALGKTLEELEKIPKEDIDRRGKAYSIMADVLTFADKSCVDLVKDHLDREEGKRLSLLFEAYGHASQGRVENAQRIFQDIIDKDPNYEDALDSMMAVAGAVGGEASVTLLKGLETEIKDLLEEDFSTIMLRFVLAGGDPETMVKMIERNWGGSADILYEITSYLAHVGKVDLLMKIFEKANHYNKRTILRKNITQITKHIPEKALELSENLPAYTKDIVLAHIAKELVKKERIEDALNVASKIAVDEDYAQALRDIVLNFIERIAKVKTENKHQPATQ